MSVTQLGIIEGFYGKPWAWEEREETVRAFSLRTAIASKGLLLELLRTKVQRA